MIKMYMNVKNSNTRKIKIETYYYEGGTNWFSGKFDERGYYLLVKFVEVTEKNGYTVERYFVPYGEYKMLIMSATRASKNKEDEADRQALQCMNILIDKVCADFKIEIE